MNQGVTLYRGRGLHKALVISCGMLTQNKPERTEVDTGPGLCCLGAALRGFEPTAAAGQTGGCPGTLAVGGRVAGWVGGTKAPL